MKNRKTLEYYVLDVFTNESYKGNPLSVVFTNGNLELEQYEKIAREFGYSETSFVYYSKTKKALRVRSFTPTGFEVDGAGHNLLGAVCAALLKKMDIFNEQTGNPFVIMKETPIPILIDFDSTNQLPIVKMKQKPATIEASIPAEVIAKAIGLSTEDLEVPNFIPTIVQTEVAHLMVPIKSLETLDKIKTDNNHLITISKQNHFEGFYCFAFTSEKVGTIVQSRFFNPLIGIDEDAATGTAAGPLAGLLNKQNIIQSNKEYQILQGVQLNQPSLIKVMVTENNVLVGGSSVITMEGKIYLT
ncbi:PhzF family phenazine biosynthesis protein [Flavobacterium sp.]|uniref:PhzF family phenazine biosynthesis protein n=1 Tax=Flavobacterium sp. TaxID=239 RepID=UPI002D16F815|nr:PhzF family phenazine biosynthesis protein [Flavobacterium sp.]HSD06065.1 PhzF family phenazine biosynthesis protein [Flavobacterium sp.]